MTPQSSTFFFHPSTPSIHWPEGSCSSDHYFSFWACVKVAKGWRKANVVSQFKKDKCRAWLIMAAWPWSQRNNGTAEKGSINKELKEGKIINIDQQRCVDWFLRQTCPRSGSSSWQPWVTSQHCLHGLGVPLCSPSRDWAVSHTRRSNFFIYLLFFELPPFADQRQSSPTDLHTAETRDLGGRGSWANDLLVIWSCPVLQQWWLYTNLCEPPSSYIVLESAELKQDHISSTFSQNLLQYLSKESFFLFWSWVHGRL